MSAEIDDGMPDHPHATEPGEDVDFRLVSSLRSPHPDGPWLLLFQPIIPDGWTVGRIEITSRGNIQLEIRSKKGGV